MKMRQIAWCSLLVVVLSLAIVEDSLATDSATEYVEQKLELKGHEKLLAIRSKPGSSLAPFTTDGCSGGLSVGWRYMAAEVKAFEKVHGKKPPWESCCVEHDRQYHTGGGDPQAAQESFTARRMADKELRQCVLETGVSRILELSSAYNISPKEVGRLYSVISELMYVAVRFGGVPCSDFPWRWGYGWPQCE